MTSVRPPLDDSARDVWSWRLRELERAGYDRDAATQLASRPEIDLHRAVDLRRSGCDIELALRILL